MRIEKLINENYSNLNIGDREIGRKITGDIIKCKEMNSEELANFCHVSRATLLRFLRKLDLNSFAEFKYILNLDESEEKEEREFDIKDICNSYHKIINRIKSVDYSDICEKIFDARKIYVYGTGNAQKAEAEELKKMLLSLGKIVIDLFDLGAVQLVKGYLKKEDLFIVISLSGETKEGIEILKYIENTDIETLSITRFANNTISRMCKNNMYVDTKILHNVNEISYELTSAFYVLIDILFVNCLEFMLDDIGN